MSVDVPKYQWPSVDELVCREVTRLAETGKKVSLVMPDLGGHYFLDAEYQARVNTAIDDWSTKKDFPEELFAELSPGARAWAGLSKRAIALHAFYNTTEIDAPADGIDPECLDWPIFDGLSAREIIVARNKSKESSQKIFKKYEDFFAGYSLRVGHDRHGLTAHDYIAGSVDRIADISRAKIVSGIMKRHALGSGGRYENRGAVIASLGSGLAEPDMWAAKELLSAGITVDRLLEFDNDPIAMAAALSRAKAHKLDHLVSQYRGNFIKWPISRQIAPRSIDYVNLVGLMDYIPKYATGYKMASNLLREVAPIVMPGGLIIFGNMVRHRPQQAWFECIWPTILQLNISEVLSIIDDAGYSPDSVSVEVSESDGLYAVYTIRVPESGEIPQSVGPAQQLLGRFVMRNMKEY